MSDANKASGRNSSYQESATLSVSHKNDEEAVLREDDDDDASDDIDANDWGQKGKIALLQFQHQHLYFFLAS
jgi:hypothetical protein